MTLHPSSSNRKCLWGAGIEEDFALLELQLQAISAASSAGTKPVETTAQLVAGFDAVGDLAYRAQLLPPVRAAAILPSLEECWAASFLEQLH